MSSRVCLLSQKDGGQVAANESSLTQGFGDKRIRKREQDRRCQRASRERTEARMAQLEQLVEGLRNSDRDSQVADLLSRLDTISKERDSLAKTLKTI